MELERQNEKVDEHELGLAQSRDWYAELYELAPVGYLVLDIKGRIIEANVAAAAMLGMKREDLRRSEFSGFVTREYQDIYRAHLRDVFSGQEKLSCELIICGRDKTHPAVRLQSLSQHSLTLDTDYCRTILIDISDVRASWQQLEKLKEELEQRVNARTVDLRRRTNQLARQSIELERLNRDLVCEIEKRKKFEADLKAQGEKILSAYQQRDYLSRRLVDLLERERSEIGSALHDDVGQSLAGASMQLEGLKEDLLGERPGLAHRVDSVLRHLREAMVHTRGISHDLRSEVLERFGLIPSIRNLVDEVQKQSQFKIRFYTKDVPEDLREGGKDLTIYRLVQEGLTNVVKHAEAKEVFINLNGRGGKILISIEDDGKGFDYGAFSTTGKSFDEFLGITIMRERTSMVGGQFRIESKPGKGTCVMAEIPIR
jgi:signal transduction histidine kinase